MDSRTVFDVDCSGVIAECGFKCPKCIEEIQSTLTGMPGVSKAYVDKAGEEQKLVVEHDGELVTVEQLVDVLKRLPSFYKGSFVPNVERQE
jgi:hypothetical protein